MCGRAIMLEYIFGAGLILLAGAIFVPKGYNFGVKFRRRTDFTSGIFFVPKGYIFGVKFRRWTDFTSGRFFAPKDRNFEVKFGAGLVLLVG